MTPFNTFPKVFYLSLRGSAFVFCDRSNLVFNVFWVEHWGGSFYLLKLEKVRLPRLLRSLAMTKKEESQWQTIGNGEAATSLHFV